MTVTAASLPEVVPDSKGERSIGTVFTISTYHSSIHAQKKKKHSLRLAFRSSSQSEAFQQVVFLLTEINQSVKRLCLFCSLPIPIENKIIDFVVRISSINYKKVLKMSAKKVLVYGGRGALGSTCVSKFKELNWVNRFICSHSFYCYFYFFFSSPILKAKSCMSR